jgi:glycolate dehydrogenase FAD-binding subunit
LPSVSSLEEASAFLREASADGRRVAIGESLVLDGFDRILEHESGDLTCTVEAGIRLSALNEALGAAGQRLSLDPPGDPTIGACLADALSGPRRHRFGTPRDLVLGVTLVLADGTVASSGGKVVKNVAGYDLGKLVCGSRGRLGLIARVSLRLHPLPAAARTLVVETPDAAGVVTALRRSQLVPSALDVLHPGRVAVLFESGEAAVRGQLESARALVGGGEADDEVLDESRERQAAARGVVRFPSGELATHLATLEPGTVVRAGSGVAYTPSNSVLQSRPPPLAALHERIRRAFDPEGILAT